MDARPLFHMFGPSHLVMLALAIVLPLLLTAAARCAPRLDAPIRITLAASLAGGWLCGLILFALRGWLSLSNGLPLNLCDWAAAALIIALITRRPFAYELGYFWGLGGTLQALLTPDIAFDFPDPQFVFFAIIHAGVLTALLYLTFRGLRPYAVSLPRVVGATLVYACVAGAADYLLGVNYGFLKAKPTNASLIDFLSPWPWYIPELVGLGILSLLLYYLPFVALDAWRGRKRS